MNTGAGDGGAFVDRIAVDVAGVFTLVKYLSIEVYV
jgi:hypothetical protein